MDIKKKTNTELTAKKRFFFNQAGLTFLAMVVWVTFFLDEN